MANKLQLYTNVYVISSRIILCTLYSQQTKGAGGFANLLAIFLDCAVRVDTDNRSMPA